MTVGTSRSRRDQDGAVVVEFAIVFVLFVTLLAGLIQYGVIFAAEQSMTHAASESVRSVVNIADTNGDGPADEAEDTIRTVLEDEALQWMDGSVDPGDGRGLDYVVNCDGCADGTTTPGGETVCDTCIQVTVTYNWAEDALIPQVIPVATPTTLHAAANVEYQ